MAYKVYTVTVELEVHGQSSKERVLRWLDEALEVDGMLTRKISAPKLMKEKEDVNK